MCVCVCVCVPLYLCVCEIENWLVCVMFGNKERTFMYFCVHMFSYVLDKIYSSARYSLKYFSVETFKKIPSSVFVFALSYVLPACNFPSSVFVFRFVLIYFLSVSEGSSEESMNKTFFCFDCLFFIFLLAVLKPTLCQSGERPNHLTKCLYIHIWLFTHLPWYLI